METEPKGGNPGFSQVKALMARGLQPRTEAQSQALALHGPLDTTKSNPKTLIKVILERPQGAELHPQLNSLLFILLKLILKIGIGHTW